MPKCWNSFGTPCVEMNTELCVQGGRFGQPHHASNCRSTGRLTASGRFATVADRPIPVVRLLVKGFAESSAACPPIGPQLGGLMNLSSF